jgi:hypothetical protein
MVHAEVARTLRGAVWGVVATVAMTLFMAFGLGRGPAPDGRPFPLLITSQLLGVRQGVGLGLFTVLAHLSYGAVAGMVITYFARPMTVAKGFGYGLFLWWVMNITWVPWLGWADFGLSRSPRFAFSTLAVHAVYGLTLGFLGARDEASHRATFDDLGRLLPV